LKFKREVERKAAKYCRLPHCLSFFVDTIR
jgi:hypothetical protein